MTGPIELLNEHESVAREGWQTSRRIVFLPLIP